MISPKAMTFAAMNTVCNLATQRMLQQLMKASTPNITSFVVVVQQRRNIHKTLYPDLLTID